MKKFDDTFLARWANETLTVEEQKLFESSQEYASYKQILAAGDMLTAPEYPEHEIFENINAALRRKQKVRKLRYNFIFGAAASVILLLSVYLFSYSTEKTFNTGIGNQMSVALPDGSEVILNSLSEIRFDKDDWNKKRSIELKGEAYFKVKKGATFSVVSEGGTVKVLGTEFNVNSVGRFFEVKCFSGQVEVVEPSFKTHILSKGEAVRTFESETRNWVFDATNKHWISGKSTFNRTPLVVVIKTIENQFGITIVNGKSFYNEIFTGSFTHDDLDMTLKTVFGAMQIEYQLEGSTVSLQRK